LSLLADIPKLLLKGGNKMWFNIFMTVFGIFVLLMVGAVAYDCYHQRADSEDAKKGWKRAFEGWIILFCLIMFDFIGRIFSWITS
jgi:hypothetical protein